jgi:hypothetical protein
MMHRRLISLALATLVLTPATSLAASATQAGYDDNDDVAVQDTTDSGSSAPDSGTPTATATPAATGSSSLPFTGLEAGLIAAAGLGLLGTGYALRRAGQDPQ